MPLQRHYFLPKRPLALITCSVTSQKRFGHECGQTNGRAGPKALPRLLTHNLDC